MRLPHQNMVLIHWTFKPCCLEISQKHMHESWELKGTIDTIPSANQYLSFFLPGTFKASNGISLWIQTSASEKRVFKPFNNQFTDSPAEKNNQAAGACESTAHAGSFSTGWSHDRFKKTLMPMVRCKASVEHNSKPEKVPARRIGSIPRMANKNH